jgi:hypothetical protein
MRRTLFTKQALRNNFALARLRFASWVELGGYPTRDGDFFTVSVRADLLNVAVGRVCFAYRLMLSGLEFPLTTRVEDAIVLAQGTIERYREHGRYADRHAAGVGA